MSAPAARLLRLLSLLQQRSRWSGPDLADRLGVDPRTVRRDVDRLRHLGYHVDSAPGVVGGYELGVGATLPPLLLDDDEATAIAIALGLSASGVMGGVAEPALSALAKLQRLLPERLRHRIQVLQAATMPLDSGDRVDADTLVSLARAATDQERLTITYTDRNQRRTERRIDSHRLVSTGRHWYLVAFDVDRSDWRTLRVDRVSEVTATGHHFRLDNPPDAAELVSRASGVAPYRFVARVVVEATPEELRARIPATVGLVEPHADGALLTVGGDDIAGMAGHLVALDLPFEALEPPVLRAALASLGHRLSAAHV